MYSGELFKNGFKNLWEFIEGDGEGERKGWRQRNFMIFMKYLKDIFNYEEIVVNVFDWKVVGDVKVVDVSVFYWLIIERIQLINYLLQIGGFGGYDVFVFVEKFFNLIINV